MNIKRIRTSATLVFIFIALSASSTLLAQQNYSSNQDAYQTQTSPQNEQTLREIEMMKVMARERREQQAQQRKMLEELESLIGGGQKSGAAQQPKSSAPQATTRVASGSTSSPMNQNQGQDINQLKQQYNADMQKASREIDNLKMQLEIANRQLDQCKTTSAVNDRQSSTPQMYAPSQQAARGRGEETRARSTQNQESIFDVPPQQQQQQQQPERQVSEADMKAQAEIEQLRRMLRERREQQQSQKQMLQDLHQQIE